MYSNEALRLMSTCHCIKDMYAVLLTGLLWLSIIPGGNPRRLKWMQFDVKYSRLERLTKKLDLASNRAPVLCFSAREYVTCECIELTMVIIARL